LLRVTRTDARVTLATAATAMGTTGVTISRLERGIQHNSELARRYEEWLKTAS
jgi:transcriptional regulator with XRE-family HTH domain